MKRNPIFLYLIIGISIFFTALGIIRGEHLTVLTKAVNLCLECIGLG